MMKELIEFSELLKVNGFTVFTYSYSHTTADINYFSFTNGKGFGYVQYERLGGPFSFTTCHLPNRNTGTGYKMEELTALTVDNAHLTCNTLNPSWAKNSDRAATKPYKDIADFLRVNRNCTISQ